MSAVPDLRSAFRDLEVWLEKTPEGTTGEIARGVYAMTPRPRPRHAALFARRSPPAETRQVDRPAETRITTASEP